MNTTQDVSSSSQPVGRPTVDLLDAPNWWVLDEPPYLSHRKIRPRLLLLTQLSEPPREWFHKLPSPIQGKQRTAAQPAHPSHGLAKDSNHQPQGAIS